jgi:hypothetical protein
MPPAQQQPPAPPRGTTVSSGAEGDRFVEWDNLDQEQRMEVRRRLMQMLDQPRDYLWTFDAKPDKWRCIPSDRAKR